MREEARIEENKLNGHNFPMPITVLCRNSLNTPALFTWPVFEGQIRKCI